jgi:alpha-1,2-mannosyltransferase
VRALDRLTRPPILTVFAALQLAFILTVAVGHFVARHDPEAGATHPGTGDYLAFHVGATLVREGLGEDLYDFEVQREVQEEVLGGARRWRQPYLNPPGLAIALAPATGLPYAWAFRLFTLAMVISFAGTVWLGGVSLPRIAAIPLGGVTATLLAAGYLPVALTMFGGQNTVLTMFLLSGVFWGIRSRRSGAAGAFVGLLSYKPQFALLPGFLLLARGDWHAVSAALGVGVVHYLVGAIFVGPAWPLEMLAALRMHAPLELAHGGAQHFSITATFHHLLPGTAASALSLLAVALAVSLVWWQGRRMDPGNARFPAFFGSVIAATMAISPHLQYYDAGLLILVGAMTLETRLHRGTPPLLGRLLLAVAYFAFPIWRWGEAVGFQPLVFLLLALLAWSGLASRTRAATPEQS